MSMPAGLANDLLKSAQLIEKRSDALVEFMEHYQSFTRLPDPVPQEIKVSVFFEGIGLFFKDELEQSRIKLEIDAGDPEICVFADRALLEQAFINLIRNSLEAMGAQEQGHIILKSSSSNGRALMEISDNGPGIPEDIQSQVFIPFFTTKPGGTGIGMSIVRKIIIMSGGSIGFRSIPGERTVFSIQLPKT